MPILGVWMWPESVRRRGAETVVGWCRRARVTDIFFLTKGLSGTAAYHSSLAPHGSERDLLQELIEAAHRQNIRVHAWLTSACDENYKKLHPESGRYHFVRGKDRELISLADEGYLRYMEDIVRELCRNCEIDGLHLDYIRYNHLLYGWAEEDLARYAAEGADVEYLKKMMHRMFCSEPKEENLLFETYRAGNESALALARARRKDVVHFAKTLIDAARGEKKNLIISAALMPEGAYEDIAFSDLHYGQNYEDAAKLFDYALPMAYSKAYEKNAEWVRMVAEGTLKRGLKTIVGLHAYDGGSGLTLQQDIAVLEKTAVHGVCLFREGAMAMAYADGRELCLYNALDEEITGVLVNGQEEGILLEEKIGSGEEKRFVLPAAVKSVQVLVQQKECSVYLTME